MTKLLAFTGTARTGKDTFANPMVGLGWTKLAYGHVIKEFYAPYIAGDESISHLKARMLQVNPALTLHDWTKFQTEVLLPYEDHDISADAFSEDDTVKTIFRPILEKGGDLLYYYVTRTYFRRVQTMLDNGQRVINPRLVRLAEARRWTGMGGIIIDIQRPGKEAVSEWEAEALRELRASGLISHTFTNDRTIEIWEAQAKSFAAHLLQQVNQ